METQNTGNEMLELMDQPAFFVRNGMIIQCNQAAGHLLIEPNTPIAPLLGSAAEEYSRFDGGCLYLTLSLAGTMVGASVSRINDLDIFKLEAENDRPEFRVLALAARELREPLAGVLTLTERLVPAIDRTASPDTAAQVGQMNQRLQQLLRLVSNMSDAPRYEENPGANQICQDVCAVLEEIFEKAAQLLQRNGVELHYSLPQESILCLINEEKLERAIYNILSNAMKFSTGHTVIHAELTRHGNKLYLSIHDQGSGIPPVILKNVFHRYQRLPGLEDSRQGLGLGMVLIRAAAAAHGGTVLITHPPEGGTRVTMTLAIRQSGETTLRSNTLRVDYAGERDHALLELSGCLPSELYRPDW